MSHRKISEQFKEEYGKAKQSMMFPSSLKDWASKTVSTNIVLFAVCTVLYIFFRNEVVIALIEIAISLHCFLILVTIHEMLHGLIAKAYGYQYEFESYPLFHIAKLNRAFTSLSITVAHPVNEKWERDKVIIALGPHFVLLPLGLFFIFLGWYWQIMFFSLLGMMTTFGHLAALYFDVKAK